MRNFTKTVTVVSKRIASIIFCVNLVCSVSFAQVNETPRDLFTLTTDTEISKAPSIQVQKYSSLKSRKLHKNIFPVKLGKLPKIQKKGVLTFKIPGSEDMPTFIAQKVDAKDEDNFMWYGTSKDGASTALFVCEKGKLGGSFNAGARNFQVYTLEGDIAVLIEEADNFSKLCASQGTETPKIPVVVPPSESPKGQNARAGVCTEPLRVLVLYTQAAANNSFDIVTTASVAAAQFNQAIDNVGRAIPQTNKITVAGIAPITFTTNDPEGTTSAELAAGYVNNNSTVQSLRNTYNADLVICLIYKAQDYAGWAVEIPANNAQFAAVVGVQFATSTGGYTFSHELGHLLGGRHHDDTNGPQYSHGYSFTGTNATQYRTIMHRGATGTRILYFSAPNINYAGVPVGTYSNNDVARRISEVSPTVVNFRPSTTQSFNATIIGPTSINTAGWYNWELYFFCQPLGSTTWQFSNDGFNYGSAVGFSDVVSNYNIDDSNNGNLFLRCTIINGGQTYVTTSTINVNICQGCRTSVAENIVGNESVSGVNSVSPNPASGKITVDFSLKDKVDVVLELVDNIGRSNVYKRLGELSSGEHKHQVDISNLTSGLYVCRMTFGGKVVTKSIVLAND